VAPGQVLKIGQERAVPPGGMVRILDRGGVSVGKVKGGGRGRGETKGAVNSLADNPSPSNVTPDTAVEV